MRMLMIRIACASALFLASGRILMVRADDETSLDPVPSIDAARKPGPKPTKADYAKWLRERARKRQPAAAGKGAAPKRAAPAAPEEAARLGPDNPDSGWILTKGGWWHRDRYDRTIQKWINEEYHGYALYQYWPAGDIFSYDHCAWWVWNWEGDLTDSGKDTVGCKSTPDHFPQLP